MIYTLTSPNLLIKVDSKGAEMVSVTGNTSNFEYIWGGDKNYWGRRCPVLFPHVGKLKNDSLNFEGKSYVSKQHGFARDQEFECVSHFENHLIFQLESSDFTKTLYPFNFCFQISYLIEENKLKISYRVINTDQKDIYFGIGAHPAFSCPIKPKNDFSKGQTQYGGYLINFEKEEKLETYHLENGLINPKPILIEEKASMLHVSRGLFDSDALIFKNLQSSWVGLAHFELGQIIKVYTNDFEWLGIWSLPKEGADFVCIEPWQSHADFIDEIEGFENKKDLIKLESNKDWIKNFDIEFCLS